jgi:hypothetical protein
MKRITARGSAKAEYETVDRDETTIATASNRNIATIVMIAIAPIIVAHDTHENKQVKSRDRTLQLTYFFGRWSQERALRDASGEQQVR